MKKIWILWWIWPEASAEFYKKLIIRIKEWWYIQSNKDFPNIIINSINAPEILDAWDDNISEYINGIMDLRNLNVEYIYMICNTIHIFYDKIGHQTNTTKIVDLRQLLYNRLINISKKVCILWTENTINSGMYNFNNIDYVSIPNNIQKNIQSWIMLFNSWKCYQNEKDIIKKYISDHKDVIYICWCTEIQELTWIQNIQNITFIETTDLFIEDIIKKVYSTS